MFPLSQSLRYALFLSMLSTIFTVETSTTHTRITQEDARTQSITISIDVPEGIHIYKDHLSISADHPQVTVNQWHASCNPIKKYDPAFEETRDVFDAPFDVTVRVTAQNDNITDAHLHVTYHQSGTPSVRKQLIPLSFPSSEPQTFESSLPKKPVPQSAMPTVQDVASAVTDSPQSAAQSSWSSYLSTMLERSESIWFRIMLALLMGLFLSLTPCIYPMIPITVGIIGSQSGGSITRNFSLSLAYTTGIASTFALLGLIAAFTGSMFGSLLAKPAFVLSVVAILAYLAFSMIGFYEMYTPRFMQGGTGNAKGGSIPSAFVLGVASGTVASPCLSPGLILLLTLVTTLGSKLAGFALLFSFGFGLGIPLLAIGTLSGSMDMMPKAGMWMVEVKKLFGFLMLGMCLYFLSTITPWHLLMWIATVVTAFIGGLYIWEASKAHDSWRTIKNIVGMLTFIGSIILGAYALRETYIHRKEQNNIWITEYQKALSIARAEHKKILLDVVTPYCSLCKVIDRKLFSDPTVCCALQSDIIPLKVDATDGSQPENIALCQRFNVVGAPTCILIDPEDETEVCRWSSELCNMSPSEFLAKIGCKTPQ